MCKCFSNLFDHFSLILICFLSFPSKMTFGQKILSKETKQQDKKKKKKKNQPVENKSFTKACKLKNRELNICFQTPENYESDRSLYFDRAIYGLSIPILMKYYLNRCDQYIFSEAFTMAIGG